MRALAARELLEIWDRGAEQAPVERALALLAGAFPEVAAEELARLAVGRRDALLLDLREQTFGPDLVGVASCPGCGEGLQTAFRAAEIRAAPAAEAVGPLELTRGAWTVRFRLPDSSDLAALAALDDAGGSSGAGGRTLLLARCVLAAERGGRSASAAELPDEVVTAIAERMEASDPQADVRIALCCPGCGHRWESVFDVLSFFWSEISVWAERTLREVHVLASAYGWREPDVLALGARRRQLYLRLVGE